MVKRLVNNRVFFILILLFSFLIEHVCGQNSNNQKISFKVDSVTLEDALFMLGKQTNIGIQYNSNIINRQRRVSADLEDVTLMGVLEHLLKNEKNLFVAFRKNQVFLTFEKITDSEEIFILREEDTVHYNDTIKNIDILNRTIDTIKNYSIETQPVLVNDSSVETEILSNTILITDTVYVTDTIYKTVLTKTSETSKEKSNSVFIGIYGSVNNLQSIVESEDKNEIESGVVSCKSNVSYGYNFEIGMKYKAFQFASGLGLDFYNKEYTNTRFNQQTNTVINTTQTDSLYTYTLKINNEIIQYTDTIPHITSDTVYENISDTTTYTDQINAVYFTIPMRISWGYSFKHNISILLGIELNTHFLANVSGSLYNPKTMKDTDAKELYYPVYSTCRFSPAISYRKKAIAFYLAPVVSYSLTTPFNGMVALGMSKWEYSLRIGLKYYLSITDQKNK